MLATVRVVRVGTLLLATFKLSRRRGTFMRTVSVPMVLYVVRVVLIVSTFAALMFTVRVTMLHPLT